MLNYKSITKNTVQKTCYETSLRINSLWKALRVKYYIALGSFHLKNNKIPLKKNFNQRPL